MSNRVLRLWGKTTETEVFHPALFHMIDVAQTARVLMTNAGSRRLQDSMRIAWHGSTWDALEAWLPFVIALHDIGKISTPFQGQQTTPSAQLQHERLLREGFRLGGAGDGPPSHSAVSAWWINNQFRTLEPGLGRSTMRAFRDAAGGHHGWFAKKLLEVGDYLEAYEPFTEWQKYRLESYHLLRQVLGPEQGNLKDIGQPQRLRPATAALTGLTVIADWVASNTQYFSATTPTTMSAAEYALHSADRARDALFEIGLTSERPSPIYAGFQQTFSHIEQMRDLQRSIDALELPTPLQPVLCVIEASTGEGKTEVALALARRLAAAGASDEIYFGLPTMATSNQMFSRLSRFYDDLYNQQGAVKLAHGQAALVEKELRRLINLGERHGDSDPSQRRSADWADSHERQLEWFGSSKRALLAPFGVGTVDQIELTGLNVRHAMLRLFGLAGKVVVIDEVHAYDTYMSTILEHALCWLASMGSHVILLSATLPAAQHQALARSYLSGLRGLQPEQIMLEPITSYPSIALYTASQVTQLSPAAFRSQSLQMRFLHDSDYAAQAQRLLDLTAAGGAVARICNRVDDAQQIYAELRQRNIADLKLVLLHARYPLDQRQQLEKEIGQLLGKDTRRSPQQRLIVIGTQVLEQSLDYDVDVMVSDLAPIDLLLQRAGRLHRHERQRPAAHTNPTLYVQYLPDSTGLPDIERWQAIYAPYVLWQTWRVLLAWQQGGVIPIELPLSYRPLIEAVYVQEMGSAAWADNETMRQGDGETRDTGQQAADEASVAMMLQQAWAALLKEQAKQRDTAVQRLTPDPLRSDALVATDDLHFIEDDEGSLAGWQVAKTRLGDRITVIPIYQHAHGLCFDAAGSKPIGPIDSENFSLQNRLLKRSLPLSDRRLIAYFRKNDSWGQKKTPPLLKFTPPLKLDQDGQVFLNGVRIRLDPLLGLVIIGKEEL